MSDSINNTNPYEAYYKAMMDMQMEMTKIYIANMQNGEVPPMPPFHNFPPFPHPGLCHPFQMPPVMGAHPYHGMLPPNHWHQPGMMQPTQESQSPEPSEDHPLYVQAQAMLDGALGEDAGTFKEILGSFGMNDKEFWKGAMVGAAAALLLSNENVRGKLMGLVSGAGSMLKSGGESVKEGAMNTASTVKENVSTGSEIFKETYAAGKQGFQESVERHKTESAPTSDDSSQPDVKTNE
ncbi:YtxH domain-containing protein [Photobacterium damselae]